MMKEAPPMSRQTTIIQQLRRLRCQLKQMEGDWWYIFSYAFDSAQVIVSSYMSHVNVGRYICALGPYRAVTGCEC